jgi:hypothetical protein
MIALRARRLNPALYSRPTSILKLGAFQPAGTVVDVQLLLASSSSHSYTVKGALRLPAPESVVQLEILNLSHWTPDR